jgi:hypothetical protein
LVKPAPTGEDANPASNQPTAVKEIFHPAQKTTATNAQASNDLSDSGAQSIQGEIDRCVADQKWEEALKWALHAVQALPENKKFRVTLAEIYALAKDRDKFLSLFPKLYIDLDHDKAEQARLVKIATNYAPDHSMVILINPDATDT